MIWRSKTIMVMDDTKRKQQNNAEQRKSQATSEPMNWDNATHVNSREMRQMYVGFKTYSSTCSCTASVISIQPVSKSAVNLGTDNMMPINGNILTFAFSPPFVGHDKSKIDEVSSVLSRSRMDDCSSMSRIGRELQ